MTNGGVDDHRLTYYGAEKWMPHYNVMGIAKGGVGGVRCVISPPISA